MAGTKAGFLRVLPAGHPPLTQGGDHAMASVSALLRPRLVEPVALPGFIATRESVSAS